jgi:hypothetical protein
MVTRLPTSARLSWQTAPLLVQITLAQALVILLVILPLPPLIQVLFSKATKIQRYVIKINNNGNITNSNNSYGSLSDAKLKENIVDASSQWVDIKSLRVRNYSFKPETGQQTHRQIGLIAQEVEEVSPGLVTDFPDANNEITKTVNYSVLYMKAVKALQEAMERIEQLEQRLTDAGIA